MNTVIWIVLCMLAATGLVQICGWLYCVSLKPRRYNRGYYLLPLPREPDALEEQLRYCLARRRWGGTRGDCLLLLDCGLNEEGRVICDKLLDGAYGVYLCNTDGLAATIEGFECTSGAERQYGQST